MKQVIERLRNLADDAVKEYNAEHVAGGEAVYPAWADDVLYLLKCVDAIGAGGVGAMPITESQSDGQEQVTVDWEAMYDQMCERCDVLDKKLAEYESQQDADKVDAVQPIGKTADEYELELTALGEQCNRLQDALAFYMPDVPEEGHPLHKRIAQDAYLLCGYDGADSNEPSAQALGLISLNVQPDPAMAVDDVSDDEITQMAADANLMFGNGINLLKFARALLKRVKPAIGQVDKIADLQSSSFPSFDAWFESRNGGKSYESIRQQEHGDISDDMKALSRNLRDYITEMVINNVKQTKQTRFSTKGFVTVFRAL